MELNKLDKDFSKQLEALKNHDVFVGHTPAVIYIESVNGCPYSCAMCQSRRTKPKNISHDLLANIL